MQQQIMTLQEDNEKARKDYEETISKLQESNTSKCQELVSVKQQVYVFDIVARNNETIGQSERLCCEKGGRSSHERGDGEKDQVGAAIVHFI
jgi:hypothetical protein